MKTTYCQDVLIWALNADRPTAIEAQVLLTLVGIVAEDDVPPKGNTETSLEQIQKITRIPFDDIWPAVSALDKAEIIEARSFIDATTGHCGIDFRLLVPGYGESS